jgi:hypothetical protein
LKQLSALTEDERESLTFVCFASNTFLSVGFPIEESFLNPTFGLGPRCSVCNFLLQFHYQKSQVALVHQGQLKVRLQILG